MAKRTRQNQSKHDAAVKSSADYYRRQGYKVQADIAGYDQPKTLNGRRPDVIAQKGKKEVVLEVETPSSDKSDRAQHRAFKKYADANKNARFRKKVTR